MWLQHMDSQESSRSRIGDPAYRQVCGQKGRNITIGFAILPVYGVLYHSIHLGGMTRDLFNQFLVKTSSVLHHI